MSDKMREALERIAAYDVPDAHEMIQIARRALAEQPAQGDPAARLSGAQDAIDRLRNELFPVSPAQPEPAEQPARGEAVAWRFSPYPAAPKFRVLTDDPDAAQFARDCGVAVTELFTAAPAPAVPDALRESYGCNPSYINGWNACRAAMLASGGKASVPDVWNRRTQQPAQGEPDGYVVLQHDGSFARSENYASISLTYKVSPDVVFAANMNWPENAPHRQQPFWFAPPAPSVPELREAVRKASQLASIACDWNLCEVEIDGDMVSTYDLKRSFDSALAAAPEVPRG